MKRNAWLKSAGFSLLELMIASGAISVIVAGAAAYFVQSQYQQKQLRISSVEKMVAKKIESVLRSPEAIKATADKFGNGEPGNLSLYRCLAGMTCDITSPALQVPFILYVKNTAGLYVPLSMSNLIPTTWDIDGAPTNCIPKLDTCPFVVETYYWVTCPIDAMTSRPATTCNQASTFHFRYQVKASTTPSSTSKLRPIPSYPPDSKFLPGDTAFAISIPLKELQGYPARTCPQVNQRLIGFNSDGSLKCECLSKKSHLDALGNLVCDDNPCPTGQKMLGFKLSTAGDPNADFVPNCVAFLSQCWFLNNFPIDEWQCGAGGWFSYIDLNRCFMVQRAGWAGGKYNPPSYEPGRWSSGYWRNEDRDANWQSMKLECKPDAVQCCRNNF
ncbi:MAG: prepilin-type N-terminal cleavage/methylation domain-containing protein [Oligoflexales bacterium]|nr:prepilin-type N-terminal cleavage/methylation domain-containing protein [Oligoflexales bacterium]